MTGINKEHKTLFPSIYHPDRSIAVYKESMDFLIHSGLEPEINWLGWTYHGVGGLIPHTEENLWSGHFFPWVESWDEIQISCNLCLFGLYKQAMVSLRCGLELGLLSVYWNLNDDGHQTVQQWLRSSDDTPRIGEIWKKLVRHRNFREFERGYDLRSRLLSFGYLHNYVHTKGYKFSNRLGRLNNSFQTFDEAALKRWFRSYKDVIKVLSICHLVKYPLGTVRFDYATKFGIDLPWFGGLRDHQIDMIEKLIGSAVFAQIAEIGRGDSLVQEVLAWVKKLPDMSDGEVEQQIANMDKQFIEMSGLQKWLENERKAMQCFSNSDKWEKRVAKLKAWARAQGFDKPPEERGQ